MRFSTVQTSIGSQYLGRNNLIEVLYRGTTVDATPLELFIDQAVNRRLVPDIQSGTKIRFKACAYNITDNTVLGGGGIVLATTSVAGVIALVDQDSVTGGSQDNVLLAVTTAGTRAGAIGVTVAADNGIQYDVVALAGIPGTPTFTPAFIRLRVRGQAAKTIAWEVYTEIIEATATGA